MESIKLNWQGEILSIQPRTRVWRYLVDNRTHYHLGYNLFLENNESDKKVNFVVAISEKQQMSGMYQIGDVIQGSAWTKLYKNREYADYYRAGSLKILLRKGIKSEIKCPPWIMKPLALDDYKARGARQLSSSLWKTKCFQCVYATMANVEIQWDFDKNIKKYRFETFCYGPLSCKFYKMGRARSVPYKNRGFSLDDGALDELCTEGRGYDD